MSYSAVFFLQKMMRDGFKSKKYIKERDEGLFGLTNKIETYHEMRK